MAFSSSLLNPENLRLGNESADCDDALVRRACSRQKPVAFLDNRRKRPLTALEDIAREAGLAARLWRSVITCGGPVTHFFLSVAMTDVIGEAVDLDALALEYSRRFVAHPGLVGYISAELERLRLMRFSDFLDFGDVEITGAGVYEYARTGLLLGYPVDSTCQVMERTIEEGVMLIGGDDDGRA
jgi:hypothetical protein